MITGTDAKPNVVTNTFCVPTEIAPLANLFNTSPEAQQIRLIVKPGIITEAKPCHSAASIKISAAFRFEYRWPFSW